MPTVQIQRVVNVPVPTYEHEGDAGLDLPARDAFILQPGTRFAAPTGIAAAIPVGYVGLVWDKSKLGIRYGMKTLGGVIDAGYRGEIHVGVHNLSDTPISFQSGDHIAQLLIQPVVQVRVKEVAELEYTDRGQHGGFQSA